MVASLVAAARSPAGHPLWHYLVVPGIGAAVLVWLKVSERRGAEGGPGRHLRATAFAASVTSFRLRRAPRTGADLALAACSAASGLIHLGVCPAHFREAFVFGLFFVLAACLQVGWAALVWNGSSRRLLSLGVAGNALVIVLWIVSRTAGLPLGPEAWRPEAVGAQDVLASLLEFALVVTACRMLLRRDGDANQARRASLVARPT